MNYKISIIVPAFNIEKHLKRCINSILSQTYQNIEIIIVNDGSTDNTKEIIEQLKNSDSRIITISQANKGVTSARLNGVIHSSGEYIGFVDGDDEIDTDMYERLLTNAVNFSADISHCGYKMTFPNRIDYYYNTGEIFTQDTLTGLIDLLKGEKIEPGLVNKLYKREILIRLISDKVMDTSLKNNEDLLMNYYLFKFSSKSIFEDWCPYHYIVRSGSAATSKINVHLIRDPMIVLRTIYNDSDNSELRHIVENRLIYAKIRAAELSISKKDRELYSIKKECIKELRRNLFTIFKKNTIRLKTKLLATMVALSPNVYSCSHKMYSIIKGTNDKYRVD